MPCPGVKTVDIRGTQIGAVDTQVTPSLIIGKNDHDVWLRALSGSDTKTAR